MTDQPDVTPGAPEVHTGTDVGDGRETRPGQTPKPDAPETGDDEGATTAEDEQA